MVEVITPEESERFKNKMPYKYAASIGISTQLAEVLLFFKKDKTWEEFLLEYIKYLEKENKEELDKSLKEWKDNKKVLDEAMKKEMELEQERNFERELNYSDTFINFVNLK